MNLSRIGVSLIYAISLVFFSASGYITFKAYTFSPSAPQPGAIDPVRQKIDETAHDRNNAPISWRDKDGHQEKVTGLWKRIGDLEKDLMKIDTSFGQEMQSQLAALENSLMTLSEERDTYQAQLTAIEKQINELEDRLGQEGQASKEQGKHAAHRKSDEALSQKEDSEPKPEDPPKQISRAEEEQVIVLEEMEHITHRLRGEGSADSVRPSDEGQGTLLVITLGSGLFRSGQVRASTGLEQAIRDAVHQIEDYPEALISVEGHTDNVPLRPSPNRGFSDNMGLSFWRATIVATKLAEIGVDAKRIKVVGYGETRPLASNDNKSGRAKNRRVEIRVLTP
ncbi:MAG: OmpA family protein [Desulfobacteraceae bacterium]|jgi:chemotaxis protein MotB